MSDSDYKDLIAELQIEYLNSFPEKIEKLTHLLKNEDWPMLEQEFHKLKGTGKTYGVPEVSELSREMERICKNGNPPDVHRTVPIGIELLQDIQNCYQKKEFIAFEIHKDSRYIVLTEVP